MASSVTAYKSIAPNEYTITPFRAYAPHTYTYVSGSANNVDDVTISFARKYVTSSVLRTSNSECELFDSIVQTFYSPIPYAQYGINTASYHPTGSTYVVDIAQSVFGEEVKPGTITVKVGTSSSFDDGKGKLYVSQSGIGYIVGQVFYDKGIVILKPSASISGTSLNKDGFSIVNASSVQVQFTSSVKLFEHSIRTKIYPPEFNFSVYNPSTGRKLISCSNAPPCPLPRDLMASQSLSPYITSIGLYNDSNELLAVAKLSNPIQRSSDMIQTFVIKFDT